MNQITEPSMYDRQPAPEWPLNAIPQRWVEALFSKMTAFYGARFADLWRGAKIDEVKKAWAVELFKLSREQLKAGSDSLTALAKPPVLPEFISHCKQARAEQAAITARRIENFAPADQKVIDENLVRIRAYSRPMNPTRANAGWAFGMLMRGTALNGTPLSVEVLRNCKQVIASSAGRAYIAGMPVNGTQPYVDLIAKCTRELEVQA